MVIKGVLVGVSEMVFVGEGEGVRLGVLVGEDVKVFENV